MIKLITLSLALCTACAAPQNLALSPDASDGPEPTLVWNVPDPNTKDTCRERRALVAQALGTGTLVVSSGPEVEGRFSADPHFFWMTAVNLPDIVLVLEATDGELQRERLFLPKKDTGFERWNGTRLAPGAEAQETTGFTETPELAGWRAAVAELELKDTPLWIHGELVGEEVEAPSGSRLLGDAAAIRTPGELAALQGAVDITQAALLDAFRVVQPGAWEYQAEAAIESGFRKRGATGPSFPSIVGSGPNSCFLHYRDNVRQFQDGDLVVMDVGARYLGFAADVTRTIPVNGKFTERQREVYQAVWDASVAGAAELKPGATIRTAHQAAAAVLDERGFGEYFFHSVGHGLGLLVHDAPRGNRKLEAGMVVTIEPGVYIAAEELGVRIENDWLITEDGARLLSGDLPSAPDELLELLAKVRP